MTVTVRFDFDYIHETIGSCYNDCEYSLVRLASIVGSKDLLTSRKRKYC